MKHHRSLFVSMLPGLIFALGMASAPTAWAADADGTSGKKPRQDMVLTGDAKCTRCHDETEEVPVLAIGKTKHGTLADKRTPTCASCHGDSETHANKPADAIERPAPDRAFSKRSTTPMEVRSGACLACHQGGKRIHWDRSAHSGAEVACSSCHQIHAARDKRTQTEVCFTCHKDQRAQLRRPSRHPILEGKVACSDCHNPHGTAGPKLLVRDNVNDTCYQCHMEKRGPFLRTHEPVQEDCSICHNPHGSTNPNLLKIRPPFLCQSCHQPTSHHSTIPNSTLAAPGAPSTANAVIMARGCVNCNTNIHGSNNASDVGGRGFSR